MTPFDSFDYMRALAANTAATVHKLNEQEFWYCQRRIAGTEFFDGFGPHPYSFQLGNLNPRHTYEVLQNAGLVTFFVVLSPDFEPSDDWTAARWKLIPLKEHFIHNPYLPIPALSVRSRQNVSMASKHWRVEQVVLSEHSTEISVAHAQMLEKKHVTTFMNYTPSCFENWATSPNIEAYAARDKEGFGIWAIGGRRREKGTNELHLVAIAAAPRAYITGGFYAIYNFLIHEIGRDTSLFFGGAPRNGEGLARFKSRFANDRKNVWAAQAILQPEVCAELQQQLGTYTLFPPYRDPFQKRA